MLPNIGGDPMEEDDGMKAFLATTERIAGEGPDPHGPGAVYLVTDWPYGPKRWISDPAFLPTYEAICGPIQRVNAFVLDRCEEQPPIAATFTPKP